jgi:hypothetical protein
MDTHQHQFTSTVSENEAQDRVDEMVSKTLMRNGARDHKSKKSYEEIDSRLRKGNKRPKVRSKQFRDEDDYEKDFYDE